MIFFLTKKKKKNLFQYFTWLWHNVKKKKAEYVNCGLHAIALQRAEPEDKTVKDPEWGVI